MAKKKSIVRKEKAPVQEEHKRRIQTKKGIRDITINKGFIKRPERRGPRIKQPLPGMRMQSKQPITPKLKPSAVKPSAKDREIKLEFEKAHPGVDFEKFQEFTEEVGLGKIGKPMSGYSYPLKRGSLWKFIPVLDSLTNHRWEFWGVAIASGKIPEKIPQIKFLSMPDPEVMKMLKKNVQYAISRGISNYQAVENLFDWILWGIGDPSIKSPPKIDEKVNEFWYRNVDLGIMMAHPHDYPARLLEEFGVRGGPGWFATPMPVTVMMTEMLYGKAKPWETVADPAAGTGSMLLPASNHSLSIFAQDISLTVLKGLRINGYLYVPWIIRPFPKSMLDDLKKRMEGKKNDEQNLQC